MSRTHNKQAKRQTFHGTLRQKGKDLMLVLPCVLRLPHWKAGQRVWFAMRGQTAVVTRKPSGPRGLRRYSSRLRRTNVSLSRAIAERRSRSGGPWIARTNCKACSSGRTA